MQKYIEILFPFFPVCSVIKEKINTTRVFPADKMNELSFLWPFLFVYRERPFSLAIFNLCRVNYLSFFSCVSVCFRVCVWIYLRFSVLSALQACVCLCMCLFQSSFFCEYLCFLVCVFVFLCIFAFFSMCVSECIWMFMCVIVFKWCVFLCLQSLHKQLPFTESVKVWPLSFT